jgi:site-specific DNA recombinase
VVEEPEAKVVRFIYEAYLKGVPLYIIKEQAKNIGFIVKGTTAVEKLLANPTYAGLLQVKKVQGLSRRSIPGYP